MFMGGEYVGAIDTRETRQKDKLVIEAGLAVPDTRGKRAMVLTSGIRWPIRVGLEESTRQRKGTLGWRLLEISAAPLHDLRHGQDPQ